ncbi:MAG: AAA family ATPase [Microcystaceae cyanobacterium]
MAQSNAVQQSQTNPSVSANPQDIIRKQPNLTAEQIQEIERIGQISPYVCLARDATLFAGLNHWRDSRICGKIRTEDTLGLSTALTVYADTNTKRRGGLIQVPAVTVLITIEERFRLNDILLSILAFLSHPISCGTLRDLRKRVRGIIKDYQVKNIIVNDAHHLSYSGFNELMTLAKKMNLSVVLTGIPHLYTLLDNENGKFFSIKQTFRDRFDYDILSLADIQTVVTTWESQAIVGKKKLNLATNQDIIRELYNNSEGKLDLLYIGLRKVAKWRSRHPRAQVNHQNVAKALSLDFKVD